MLQLPESLVTGDILAFAQRAIGEEDGLRRRFTFAGGEYFKRMEAKGMYSINPKEIKKRVRDAGLENIYNKAFV